MDISSKFDGRLEQVTVQVGDPVRKGDVLARLDTTPLQHEQAIATADLQAARAEEEVAKLAHQSAQETLQRGGDARLVSLGAMSEEEQARLRFSEKTAAAKLAAAQALVQSHQARVEQLRLRLSEATLRAPFDARVSMRYLDPGHAGDGRAPHRPPAGGRGPAGALRHPRAARAAGVRGGAGGARPPGLRDAARGPRGARVPRGGSRLAHGAGHRQRGAPAGATPVPRHRRPGLGGARRAGQYGARSLERGRKRAR